MKITYSVAYPFIAYLCSHAKLWMYVEDGNGCVMFVCILYVCNEICFLRLEAHFIFN